MLVSQAWPASRWLDGSHARCFCCASVSVSGRKDKSNFPDQLQKVSTDMMDKKLLLKNQKVKANMMCEVAFSFKNRKSLNQHTQLISGLTFSKIPEDPHRGRTYLKVQKNVLWCVCIEICVSLEKKADVGRPKASQLSHKPQQHSRGLSLFPSLEAQAIKALQKTDKTEQIFPYT